MGLSSPIDYSWSIPSGLASNSSYLSDNMLVLASPHDVPSDDCPDSSVSKDQGPVYKILERLPYELLRAVVSHITTVVDLRSLALVNKLFQGLAEPGIYKDIRIRFGSQAIELASSISKRPVRATWICQLWNSCHIDFIDGLAEVPKIIPMMTNLETLVVETPDCNNIASESRIPWIRQQEAFGRVFVDASQLNSPVLSKLRSCTLHFVDEHRSLYSLGHYSVIFVHPTLTHLTISCASIDPPQRLHPQVLRSSLINTTPLETLDLIECDFDPKGLYQLLRLPRQLSSLTVTEAISYAYYAHDRRYSGLSTPEILHPVSNFQPNLRHLRIARVRLCRESLFALPRLDLTPFSELTSVEYAHVQGPQNVSLTPLDYCDLVHRAGPQHNTGAPRTSTLIYSDIPRRWWEPGIAFFACAFKNKVSHGIEKLKTLKLVLVDDELIMARAILQPESEQERRQNAVERVRRSIRQLGALGRRREVGVRVIVDWVRPNGHTIPPYLMGEYIPEIIKEYDSGPIED